MIATFPRLALFNRKTATTVAMGFIVAMCLLALSAPTHALDLVGFTGITGPMTSVLTIVSTLSPGIKAFIGFLGFVVALVSLAALRNFGSVLFYIGLAIFASVGLGIAGAIMGMPL